MRHIIYARVNVQRDFQNKLRCKLPASVWIWIPRSVIKVGQRTSQVCCLGFLEKHKTCNFCSLPLKEGTFLQPAKANGFISVWRGRSPGNFILFMRRGAKFFAGSWHTSLVLLRDACAYLFVVISQRRRDEAHWQFTLLAALTTHCATHAMDAKAKSRFRARKYLHICILNACCRQ